MQSGILPFWHSGASGCRFYVSIDMAEDEIKTCFLFSIIFAFASDICEWQFAIGVIR